MSALPMDVCRDGDVYASAMTLIDLAALSILRPEVRSGYDRDLPQPSRAFRVGVRFSSAGDRFEREEVPICVS
jgi:hypothetical protein